ncbi:cullin-4A [Sodiomyces alkalinus F11]|uniref:Cullin-4A n=1 Tax=Sodiomyces alkalinus (strain CBS 110278 / VKM F-3762 / F11) TaxID=1314773 RepID=A0A3N2PNF7_SODAK|nr:cullin-4A [Sodiomyces alkalinus F11]ROT35960.1 cullin-4A [Sodiomyces alkalinus F11]
MSGKMKGKLPDRQPIDLTQQTAFRPYAGAKKLVIKNLRTSSTDEQSETYCNRTEQELREALVAIFRQEPLRLSLERLYRGVEDMCRHGREKHIYTLLYDVLETHLQSDVWQIVSAEFGSDNIEMLRVVIKQWQLLNRQIVIVRSIYSYLDRTYVLGDKSLYSVNDLTIAHFRKMLWGEKTSLSPWARCVAAVCDMVAFDRAEDKRFDSGLLRDSIMMFHVLSIYQKSFEKAFLSDSKKYFFHFAEERSAWSLKEYILACTEFLASEGHRCNAYNFDTTTKKQLLNSAHDIVIIDYTEKLLNPESLAKLLAENEVGSMKALYDLLRLSGIQIKLTVPLTEYVQRAGAAIVGDTERGDEMVMRLLELRRSLDIIVRDAFGGDEKFVYDIRQAFCAFMDDRQATSGWPTGTSKIGEMIAKHIDLLLRGGIKALPKTLLSDHKDRAAAEQSGQSSTGDEDAELDRQLDQALELFRFIEGKDAFEAFYKKDLARRLLMGRSASQDAERNMLRKLRDECGANFTRNLEQMFKDQEIAKGEMEAFKEHTARLESQPPVDLQVMVISAAAWPSYPEVRLRIPKEIAKEAGRFEQWYKHKHEGRKLTWAHSLANCTIKAIFPKGTKELSVSAYQAVVLVLFNDVGLDDFLSYEQISTATGLQGGDLDRTLQSLACGKVRVLTKHPKGRDVNPTDTFTINKAFSDPKIKIKINQIQLKETKEENKATHDRIVEDRKYETQAVIVRIMKARKTMGHSELLAEVFNHTRKRGPLDPSQVKKMIETLIDKDYLEREGNMYHYVS